MKKFVSVLLAMMLVLGCFAACGTKAPANVPGSSLEVLENIWNQFGENLRITPWTSLISMTWPTRTSASTC